MFLKYADKNIMFNLDTFSYISMGSASTVTDEEVAKRYKPDWNRRDSYIYLISVYGYIVGADEATELFKVGYQYDSSNHAAEEKAKELAQKVYSTIIKAMIDGERVVELQNRYCFYDVSGYGYNSTVTLKAIKFG